MIMAELQKKKKRDNDGIMSYAIGKQIKKGSRTIGTGTALLENHMRIGFKPITPSL